jgi:cytochrome bd-type quinol oxidase subunit 1
MLDLPTLAPTFTRMRTVVGVGTLLWLLAAAAAFVAVLAGSPLPPLVLTTCIVGAGLGGVGWALFTWQRSAARRGSRTAQQGLEE